MIDEYDTWLFDEFKPYLGKRIVEIGCGIGNQITHLLDRDLIVGIDTSNKCICEIQQRFAGHMNVQSFALSITDPQVLGLRDFEFDTAFSLNVLEHIEDDQLALANVWTLLQPKGVLILIVPAHEWLYGTMDRSIGHYRRYTMKVLTRKLERAGFSIIFQKYMNMLGAIGWSINGRILGRQVPPIGQLRVINSLIPFLRTVEGYFTPPFGISLLSIARKANKQ